MFRLRPSVPPDVNYHSGFRMRPSVPPDVNYHSSFRMRPSVPMPTSSGSNAVVANPIMRIAPIFSLPKLQQPGANTGARVVPAKPTPILTFPISHVQRVQPLSGSTTFNAAPNLHPIGTFVPNTLLRF